MQIAQITKKITQITQIFLHLRPQWWTPQHLLTLFKNSGVSFIRFWGFSLVLNTEKMIILLPI